MNTLTFRQRLVSILPHLCLLSVVFSPVYFLVYMIVALLGKRFLSNTGAKATTVAVCVLTAIFVVHGGISSMFLAAPHNLSEWLFQPHPLRLMPSAITVMATVWVGFTGADRMLLLAEQQRKTRRYTHASSVNLDNRTHLFCAGTTGSGKTTAALQYIQDSIARDEPLYILSGKNGTDDPRSLLNSTKALAAKHGRELIVISLNRREPDRQYYNPFANMTPTEMSDALACISAYTEPHYKACTTMWIKAVCECLQLAGIPLSLQSVCDFYSFNTFKSLVARLKESDRITKSQMQRYLSMQSFANEAALSLGRYQNLLLGDGADLFGDGIDFVNATIAKERNAILFVDLDSFRYTDYTRSIGQLFLHDIRHIVSEERDVSRRKRVVLDELGAYATEELLPLFSQARSYGYQIIVATQSIADLDAVSETFAERVLENCGQYLVLQLNSARDAETMSNIIGTFETVETTHKATGSLLASSGVGTKKIVHEYKVSPDTIKELLPLNAIYYDKHNVSNVQIIKVPFIS